MEKLYKIKVETPRGEILVLPQYAKDDEENALLKARCEAAELDGYQWPNEEYSAYLDK